MVVRSYDEELKYLERLSPHCWRIKKGFQPNMNVEGVFYVNAPLERLMLDELRNSCRPGAIGGFLPGVKQIANVAALPGIVGRSVGLPDVHAGYGFAIGERPATAKLGSRLAAVGFFTLSGLVFSVFTQILVGEVSLWRCVGRFRMIWL